MQAMPFDLCLLIFTTKRYDIVYLEISYAKYIYTFVYIYKVKSIAPMHHFVYIKYISYRSISM